jgi:hypothetical protein
MVYKVLAASGWEELSLGFSLRSDHYLYGSEFKSIKGFKTNMMKVGRLVRLGRAKDMQKYMILVNV